LLAEYKEKSFQELVDDYVKDTELKALVSAAAGSEFRYFYIVDGAVYPMEANKGWKLGEVTRFSGRLAEAKLILEEGLNLVQRVGGQTTAVWFLVGLGELSLAQDDYYQVPYSWGYYGSDSFIERAISKPVIGPSHSYSYQVNPDIVALTNQLQDTIKYNKTPFQIILAWAISKGIFMLTNTMNMAHLKDSQVVKYSMIHSQLWVELYQMDLGLYPTESQGLKVLVERPALDDEERAKRWRGPYLPAPARRWLKDAWGSGLRYHVHEEDVDGKTMLVPHVRSAGPDRTYYTDDDVSNRSH